MNMAILTNWHNQIYRPLAMPILPFASEYTRIPKILRFFNSLTYVLLKISRVSFDFSHVRSTRWTKSFNFHYLYKNAEH